jgi:hypothetical protein
LTTARHRRPSPGNWIQVVVALLLGAALGAGGLALASSVLPTRQGPQQTASVSTAPARQLPPRPGTPPMPVAFAPPATDPVGMSVTVLRPERVKGGVRFTIALVNTSNAPLNVDTGALGPHEPRFNNEVVPMSMTPVFKKLMPGEGYTYQCVFKLPTMQTGQVAFTVGPVTVSGPAAGD